MKRQVGIKFDEALLAEAQSEARRRGMTFTAYVTGLLTADLYAGVDTSEQWATMQQMADMQSSFDDMEGRLAALEEIANREAY